MNGGSQHVVGKERVRPALRRIAIVAFAILVPVAAYSFWDYIEIRRLVREIERIRDKGEPVTEQQARLLTAGAPPGAGSYYMAGAVLALHSSPYGVMTPIRERLAQPKVDRESLLQIASPLLQLVQESRDPLLLADKAAGLPFNGFPAGTEFSYRTSGLLNLSELITARTLNLSLTGNGDAAVDSVMSALQIRRALRDLRWLPFRALHVASVLSLSQPSPEALGRLQVALEAEDRPEQQLQGFLRDRASYIETIWSRYYGASPAAPRHYSLPMRSITETVLRPWFTHRAVHVLRVWAELVDVARLPWPQKAQAGAAAREKYRAESDGRPSYYFGMASPALPVAMFNQAVDAATLIVDRCSKVAVAIERFRRDRNALPGALGELVPQYLASVPVDPYSGGPLLFRSADGAYTIYSIGPNQKDDSGDLTSELERAVQRGWGRRVIGGADVGVRVWTQH